MKFSTQLLLAALLASISQAYAAVNNDWTDWINRDLPSGSGDYELLGNFQKERPNAVCSEPTDIQARLRGEKAAEIFSPSNPPSEKIRTFSAERGFACVNSDQTDKRCQDYEVRFLCAPAPLGKAELPIASSDVLQLLEPQKEGNGIAIVSVDKSQLTKEPPSEFSIDNDGVITVVNDEGVGADAIAGDLVFSGFVNIDKGAVESLQKTTEKRLAIAEEGFKGEIAITEFNGRTVSRKQLFAESSHPKLARALPTTFNTKFAATPILKPFPTPTPPPLVQPENALVINDLDVVAHPQATFDPCNTDGAGNDANPDALYSFKTLITNLNDETLPGHPSDQQFVHNWLRNWMTNSSANGFSIPPRTGITDYFPGWNGVNASTLDLDQLPFRLLAIVNRIDLANVSAYGNSNPNKPGEIRFVFGLVDINTSAGSCNIATGFNQMTAIFEYRDATNSCSSLQNLANDWIDLDNSVVTGTTTLGSAQFMADLKAITDSVTQQGANKLNQLRTNDFAFDGRNVTQPWQLREFVLDNTSLNLEPATIKQTPDFTSYRGFFAPGSATLANYVVNAADEPGQELLCDAHSVPNTFNGIPFLGAHTDYLPNTSWPVNFMATTDPMPTGFPSCYTPSYIAGTDAGLSTTQVLEIEMRHKLSLNACDDCHAGETNTFFTHINPVNRNLSGFMTGIIVNDPTPSPIQREFDDIARRNQAMSGIATAFCGFGGPILIDSFQAQQAQLNMEH